MRSFGLAAAALLLLAGCAQSPSDVPEPPSGSPVGPAVPEGPHALAPVWSVGQSWSHRWFLGANDTEGSVLPVVVAEDRGPTWALASPDPATAAIHAAFVMPTLGEFSKTTLDASVGEYNWPWYQFPLTDGLAWSTTAYSPRGDGTTYTYAVDFVARHATDLTYLGNTVEGFRVEGTVAGAPFIATDYVPDLGWFGTLTIFAVEDSAQSAKGDLLFRVVTEETGNHTGTVYSGTATTLLRQAQNVVPPGGVVEPAPYGSFLVDDTPTHVLAFPYAYAATGASEAVLVDPNNQAYRAEAVAPQGVVGNAAYVFTGSVPGEWRFATAGAGVAAGGGIDAYGVLLLEYDV